MQDQTNALKQRCIIRVNSNRRIVELAEEFAVPSCDRNQFQYFTTMSGGAVIWYTSGLFPLMVADNGTIHTCSIKGDRILEFREDWTDTYQRIPCLIVEPYEPEK